MVDDPTTPDALASALARLERGTVPRLVQERLERGDPPASILESCREGMEIVGRRFQEGEYYLAELLLSADSFKEAVDILDPWLRREGPAKPRGRIVLATMRGDIHDLGKNILTTLLRVHAIEVTDLGVDVEPTVFIQTVKEIRPDFVGFSSLITTSFESTREAVEGLCDAGLREELEVLVGGGVTTPSFRDYVGADFQTLDAAQGVQYCLDRTETIP